MLDRVPRSSLHFLSLLLLDQSAQAGGLCEQVTILLSPSRFSGQTNKQKMLCKDMRGGASSCSPELNRGAAISSVEEA